MASTCGFTTSSSCASDFGVVLQDPFLFAGTIADNIRLGSDWITDEQMKQAAGDVNLLDYIEELPGGFEEPVRERGATLSTGRKQLINFARALAHDPKILILDEATSSVDTDTELLVRSALERMVDGRTSVVIAHRLSTVQRADAILVMHKGQLREMGTHQELLARRGLYYKLYQLQYKDQELPSLRRRVRPDLGRHRLDGGAHDLSLRRRGKRRALRHLLIHAIRRLAPDASFFGLGGERMEAARLATSRPRRRRRGHGHHRSHPPHATHLRRVPEAEAQPSIPTKPARRRRADRLSRRKSGPCPRAPSARHPRHLLRQPPTLGMEKTSHSPGQASRRQNAGDLSI